MKVIVSAAVFAAAIALVAALNEPCSSVNDCHDSGTTCRNGRCECWISQGFSTALTWACDFDQTCQILFPGHLCKPSRECQQLGGRMGFCIPIPAIRN